MPGVLRRLPGIFGASDVLGGSGGRGAASGPRERVLARALATPRQAPAPRPTPHALPLFLLVPVMAVLVAATRIVALQLEAWLDASGYGRLVLLAVLGPTASAALLLLALGAGATLALAPALFLESRGPRRTLGAHT